MRKTNCWLSNFNLEYISAEFHHEGERIHEVDMEERYIEHSGKMREFDVGKKDCFDRNNARNKDAFAIAKANFILEGEKRVKDDVLLSTNLNETEDALIALIDDKEIIILR